MREMKDSGIEWIGQIPSNWNLLPFKYILKERSQKNNPIQLEERLSLSIGIGITLYSEKTTNLDRFKDDVSQYKLTYRGDLVINSMNVIVGAVGVTNYDGCVSPAYYTFYDEEIDHITSKFCEYVFLTPAMGKILYSLGKGIMAIDRGQGRVNTCRLKVSKYDLGRISIAIPNVGEQRKIVKFLNETCSDIDLLTSDIQKQIDTLEQYKKSVITEAVTKGLNPDVEMKDSDEKWLGVIPTSWQMRKGKYIFTQRSQRGNNIELQLLSPTQKYGVIPQSLYEKLSGMNAVKLDEKTDLTLLKTIHKGDYCISLRSFQGGFEYSEYEGVVSPAYQVFYAIDKIDEGYYKYLFKDREFINKMNSYTMSLRDGKNIAYVDFGNTYIPYPTYEEQKKIADFLDKKCSEIDTIISDKKKQLKVIAEYKKSLIYEYVTGKKEVM